LFIKNSIEGEEPNDDQYPKDGEPILPSEPLHSQAGQIYPVGSSEPQGKPQVSQDQIEQIKGQLKQFEKFIPNEIKNQLLNQLLEGKLNLPFKLPPAVSSLASSLSPDQIKSLAASFLGDNKQQSYVSVEQQLKQYRETLKQQNKVPQHQLVHSYQDISGSGASSESQQIQSFFRPGFIRPLNPGKPIPFRFNPLQQSELESLSVFGSEGSAVRIPAQNVQTIKPQERPVISSVQFVPIDGRPNGSPQMDQIEHLLSAALQAPQTASSSGVSQTVSPGNLPVHHHVVHLEGHESPIHGHYSIFPQGVAVPQEPPQLIPVAHHHPIPPQITSHGHGIPSLPELPPGHFLHQTHPGGMVILSRHPVIPHLKQIGPKPVARKPIYKSAYSNGWIPKDLPNDWSPGHVGSTRSPDVSDMFLFTASDSITPRPPARFTPPGHSLRPAATTRTTVPVKIVSDASTTEYTSTTTVPSTAVHVEKPTEPEAPTSPLSGKTELIKLWLSQTPKTSTEGTAAPDLTEITSRKPKALRLPILPLPTTKTSVEVTTPANKVIEITFEDDLIDDKKEETVPKDEVPKVVDSSSTTKFLELTSTSPVSLVSATEEVIDSSTSISITETTESTTSSPTPVFDLKGFEGSLRE